LHVVLGTPGSLPQQLDFATVRSLLNRWFLRVAKVAHALKDSLSTPQLGPPFDSVLVEYSSVSVSLGSKDILVYLVPDREHSFIRPNSPGFPDFMEDGLTKSFANGKTCSEVYVDQVISWGPQAIAAVAFHEAMHNRTGLGSRGDSNLHTKEGVVLGAYPVPVT